MINKLTLFFFIISLLIIPKYLYALSASSYLISNIAFKSYDFKNVFEEVESAVRHDHRSFPILGRQSHRIETMYGPPQRQTMCQ